MKVWTSGMLAISLAGHDKGALFVVLEEPSACKQESCASSTLPEKTTTNLPDSGVYYLLADGKSRTLEHPKKKKAKHVQVITHLSDEMLSLMKEITLDAHVRKILMEYQNQQSR